MTGITKIVNAVVDSAAPTIVKSNADLLAELRTSAARTLERNGGQTFASTGYRAGRAGTSELAPTMHTNVKAIARGTDLSVRQVRDAIHALKNELKIGGARSNPDVVVDTSTGDVFEQVGSNAVGELMGNLHAFVR